MAYPPIEETIVTVTWLTKFLSVGEKFIIPIITSIGIFLGGGWWARKKLSAEAGKTTAEAEVTLANGAIRRAEDMRLDLKDQREQLAAQQVIVEALRTRAGLRDQENVAMQLKVAGHSSELAQCKKDWEEEKVNMYEKLATLRQEWDVERTELRAEIVSLKEEIARQNQEIARLLSLLDTQVKGATP